MKHITNHHRFSFSLFFCLLISIAANAQMLRDNQSPSNQQRVCASSILLNTIDAGRQQAFEQNLYNKALDHTRAAMVDTEQYTLPIVYHIIHENGIENIPDGDLWDATQLLNEAYKNIVPFDPANGVNINIDFCLSASAITRRVSPLTNVTMETDDSALKQLDQWDPHSYINIWVVNSITSLNLGPGVAGYAMMPVAHGLPIDGIVIEASFLHNHPDDVKVLVHEMGHYLGLYHTFEGGCVNNNCLLDGDRVCDTPPDNSVAPVNCPATVNTCHTDSDDPSANNPFRSIALGGLGDQPDMYQNYMDYGFQSCQNRFTDGQRTRMRDALIASRHSLLEHPGLCAGCANPIVATVNVPATAPAGVPVTFSVTTANTGLTIIWLFNNQAFFGSSTVQTYPTAGRLPVTVLLTDPSSPACNIAMYDTIEFTCAVPTPVLAATPEGLSDPGLPITFTTPDNGYTYTWNIDGAAAGTGATFSYTPGTAGQLITVTANNGTCETVSTPYYINPGNCADSKENNTWYFGSSAGINFNTSPPQAIPGQISTDEGCAVLSDAITGAPMFHSDGSSVANSQTGATLLNGSGLTGSYTTTQSALFVPQPGSAQYVYLFTLDYQATDGPFGGGLFYSVIDKSGDGGQGAVTTKNQLMQAPMTEKLTAVKNLSGNGIWILAHKWNTDEFYAWLLTSSGLSTPVISHAGSIHTNAGPNALAYSNGEMKTSPSGRKIAVAMQGQGMAEVFDFNNNTGTLSNAVNLTSTLLAEDYGLAFSPDERFLYVSAIGQQKIVRFDLSAASAAAITASGVVIGSSTVGQGGSIQLAPDGKIYGARNGSHYLSVISNPNSVTPASCGYLADGFKLTDYRLSLYGLPNPVQSTLASVKPVITGPERICLSGPAQTVNYACAAIGHATYSWTHQGPNTFTFISDSTATVTYHTAGIDTLIVKRTAPCGDTYDTLVVTSGSTAPFSIGPDRLVCPGTTVTLDAGAGMVDYAWNNTTQTQTNAVNTPGLVSVQVTTAAGCVLRDTMRITNYTLPSLQLGRDTSICAAETVTLDAPAGMDSYLWSTGATATNITVSTTGMYSVSVGKFGCLFKDSIQVIKNVPPNVIASDSIVVCIGQSDTYTALGGFDTYSWQLPAGGTSTGASVVLNDPGYYVLTCSNRCGTTTDSLYNYIPQVFPQSLYVSCADTIRLISPFNLISFGGSNPAYNSYIWNVDTVDIYRSGAYNGIINYSNHSASCYIVQPLTVLVDTALARPSRTINLGPDVSYCEGHVLALNAGAGFEWYHWNTGSMDSSTTVYGFGQYYVTAHLCGFNFGDTITVTQDHSVTVSLGADVYKCPATTANLDAGAGYDWYSWSSGDHTQQLTVSGNGQYSISVGLNGCVARDTVMVHDVPVSLSISGDSILCAGETLTLTTTNSAGMTYAWDSLGTQVAGDGNVLEINSPGTYHVKNQTCAASPWSAPFVVNEEILAPPAFAFAPDSVCAGDSISVSFNSSAYHSYHWQDGSTHNPRTFISSALPALTVNGIKCSDTYTLIIPVKNPANCITAVNGWSDCKNPLYLTPNPGNDFVTLGSTCAAIHYVHVTVSAGDGKLLGATVGELEDVNVFLNRLMQGLNSGMYIVKAESGNEVYYFKWMVMR